MRDTVGLSSSNLVPLDVTSHEAGSESGAMRAQIHAQNLSSLDELRRQANDEGLQKASAMHGLQGKRNEKSRSQADMGR